MFLNPLSQKESQASVALFLSTTVNQIDKKGRVSVPAGFRSALNSGGTSGVVLFRSPVHECLEGFDPKFMEDISSRLDHFDMFSETQDDLATAIFGEAVPLSVDDTGRITLNGQLMEHANLNEKAAFVGLGQKFQIWSPEKLEARQRDARKNVKDKGLTLPKTTNKGGDV